jgi:hypothetical protein
MADRFEAPRGFLARIWSPTAAAHRLKHREVVLAAVQDSDSVIYSGLFYQFPGGFWARRKEFTELDHWPAPLPEEYITLTGYI